MKRKIVIEVDADAVRLTGLAYSFGFQREDPRKKWSEREIREAARFAVESLLRERLK